jgi:choline dehydrogenase
MTTYAFIVVGAGSAGSTLAYRLSEGGESVLVLEAGTSDVPANVDIPYKWPTLLGSDVDWKYESVPQRHLGDRKIKHSSGRLIGGSSNFYHMIHIRGHASDFDNWAYNGAPGWSYAEVVPWFQKLENQQDGTNPTGGKGGPLDVVSAGQMPFNPSSQTFLEACKQAGHPSTDDFNGPNMIGAGWHHLNIRAGKRYSCRRAYLEPAIARPQVTLLTGAAATRLLLEGGRCVGVEYVRDGKVEQARAEREVIVSMGAIASPKLLMLSGIGPAEHLREVKVEVKVDLPGVGTNFHDHVLVVGPVVKFKEELAPGQVNLSESCLFTRSSAGGPGPDLQLGYVHAPADIVPSITDRSLATLITGLVRPMSRGSLRLASANPGDAPLIDANYLADGSDLDRLVEGMHIARDIIATDAIQGATYGEVYPADQAKTDDQMRTFLRANVDSYWHSAGSCKMGIDDLAVVDPQLRVRGVDGLRIADGSVMPTVVSGNCHTAIVMVAERAAAWATGQART